MSYDESKAMEKLWSGEHTERWAHKKIVNQRAEIEQLKKQLAESVPESEIKSLLYQSKQVGFWVSNHDAYEYLYDELEKLLTNNKE